MYLCKKKNWVTVHVKIDPIKYICSEYTPDREMFNQSVFGKSLLDCSFMKSTRTQIKRIEIWTQVEVLLSTSTKFMI